MNGRRGSARVGVIAALALLVAGGVGYRVTAERLARSHASTPVPRGTLAALPLRMGDWSGEDIPLSDAVVEITDTDDHLNRAYVRSAGRDRVSLFVGSGVKTRDLMPHRPEVCYVGQGWTLLSSRPAEVTTPSGGTVPCQIHEFRRGALDPRSVSVLNYYIVNGRYCRDVAALRSEAWKFTSDVAYVAQVQVAAGGDAMRGSHDASAMAFAAVSAEPVRDILDAAVVRVAGSSAPSPGVR